MDFTASNDNPKDMNLETRAKDNGEPTTVNSNVKSASELGSTGHYEAHLDPKVWQGKFADVKVVDTDYENWAVVWSCGSLAKQGWVLLRTKTPSAEILTKVKEAKALIELGDGELWRTTKQDDDT